MGACHDDDWLNRIKLKNQSILIYITMELITGRSHYLTSTFVGLNSSISKRAFLAHYDDRGIDDENGNAIHNQNIEITFYIFHR